MAFGDLLEPTADLAARLHAAGLHHRDLYLCHFFVSTGHPSTALRLIDAARVKRLPSWPTRRRWIVKDLAQFWYSMRVHPITDQQRQKCLERYVLGLEMGNMASLRKAIERKCAWIARHDRKLNKKQPRRNISIPN